MPPTTLRRVVTWSFRVATWLVILGAATVLAASVLMPRVGGATPHTVLTGSMEPTYRPGSLVVVRPVEPGSIHPGDVITYQLESGKPTVVTHRVVSRGVDGAGELVFRTQGDANEDPDAALVRPVQIKGEIWYAMPYLGYVSNLLNGRDRQLGVYAVAAGLAGYALLSFAGAVRDRRRTGSVSEHAGV